MTTIQERLRKLSPYVEQQPPVHYEAEAAATMIEAADTIDKLVEALEHISNRKAELTKPSDYARGWNDGRVFAQQTAREAIKAVKGE